MKKLLAALLSLSLALPLAGCPAAGDSSGPAPDGSYVRDFTQAVAGVDPDTVMFTVDGIDVTAEYYFYWLAYTCTSMDMNYQMYLGQPLDFDEPAPDGSTAAEYLKEDARRMAAAYLLLEREAKSSGGGATQEQLDQWAQQKADYITQEGQEGYDKLLRAQGISEETFERIGVLSYLVDNVLASIPDPTQEEADAYRTANSLYGAKHILILTAQEGEDGTVTLSTGGAPKNEDGTDFTGTAVEYNAAARAKAEDLLAQIDASDDPLATFDALMNLYSQDTGLQSNPDGYTFTPETNFVEEFKNAVYGLEVDAHSGIIESSYGYHIMLRTLPDVAEEYRSQKMGERMEGWANLEFTPSAAYEALDVRSFYENYTAYVQSLDPPEESGQPSDSQTPAGSESPSQSPSQP